MFDIKHSSVVYLSAVISAMFLTFGCDSYPAGERIDSLFNITEKVQYFYDLSDPTETYTMPNRLIEISGISYMGNDLMICVEDERGMIYTYDLGSKSVVNERKFAGDGDYEDIAYFDDTVVVLKSNGDLLRFLFSDPSEKALEFDTPLKSENDTEGLCYDPITKRLLIACKEKIGIDGKKTDGNPVYVFDGNDLLEDPFIKLKSRDLKEFFENYRDYTYDEERILLKPSGIAFNPLDGFFYIIASVGKMMVVVDREGHIQATYSIPEELLKQPEGISFSSSGDLWISSEGVNGNGRILQYKSVTR